MVNVLPEDLQEIETRFTYHSPKGSQPVVYQTIRDIAKQLAFYIKENVPSSREQSLAITKLEEAVMWANAGVARRSS